MLSIDHHTNVGEDAERRSANEPLYCAKEQKTLLHWHTRLSIKSVTDIRS